MDQKKIDRINELYHKKQEGTLAEEEREEQWRCGRNTLRR